MREFWEEHKPEIVIGGILFFAISLVVVSCIASVSEHTRLMKQCMDDGKKEYECESMLKDNTPTTVYIPVH